MKTESKVGFFDIQNATDAPGVFGDRQIEIGATDTVWLNSGDHDKLTRLGYIIQPNTEVAEANDLLGVSHKRDQTADDGISDAPVMFTRDDIAINAGTHLSSTQGVNVNAINAANAGAAGMTVEEATKINSDITGETRVIGDPAYAEITEEENTMSDSKPGSNAGGKELAKAQKEREQAAKDLPSQSPQLAAINEAAAEHYEEPEHNTVKDEHKANKPAAKASTAKADSKDDGKDSKANKTSQTAPNNVGKADANDDSTINSQITPGNVGTMPQTIDPAAKPEKPSQNHPANVNMP